LLRLLLLCNLFLLNLFACQGGYYSCVQKVKDSHTIQKNSLYIPVKNHKILVYSQKKPAGKILKEDPFLSLYLIKATKSFAYPFDVNMRLQLGTAIVNAKRAQEGKILKHQIGLNSLARYSAKVKLPALITSSCCSLEGIVTPRGVIEKEYLQRFLSNASCKYASLGIRVQDEQGFVIVSASNPYLKRNPFKKGDCILSFDGKKAKKASLFMRKVLFSKIGSKHRVKIKRNGKIMKLNVTMVERFGGGDVSDTFLEYKGIYFDENLNIVKLSQYFREYGLKIGDRLMQVNGTLVTSEDELRKYIEDFKDFSSLLFSRNNFQFFVNIK